MELQTYFRTRQEVPQKAKPKKQNSKRVATCTILVIDDDPAIQRLIGLSLAGRADVLQELDGTSEFVQNLNFDGVDVVVLDYKMPKCNGLEVLKKIRSKYKKLPVLFMTGFGDINVAEAAIEMGANEYIPKPFEPADLREVIKGLVPAFETSGSKSLYEVIGESFAEVDEREDYFESELSSGRAISGRVLRYHSGSVLLESKSVVSAKYVGDHLDGSMLTLGNRSVEVAGSRVLSIDSAAGRKNCLVEVSLPGVWDIGRFEEQLEPAEIMERTRTGGNSIDGEDVYKRFSRGLEERNCLPEAHRTVIADVEHMIQEFIDDLEPFEKLLNDLPSDERAATEQRIVSYAEQRFFPPFTVAMQKFEEVAAAAAEGGFIKELRSYSQRRWLPLMLASPFISRVVEQPIGVPGDFGILGALLGDPYMGHSLFGRIMNAWMIKSDAALAYQYRVKLLTDSINEAAERCDRAEVLSMASGVAYEVQNYVLTPRPEAKVDFDLIDFSERTLEEADRLFSNCREISDPENITVNLRQGSVLDLAQQSRFSHVNTDEKQYDLVYCAGLYDYLSDRMCRSVTNYLYGRVKPGGKLVVSNFCPKNSLRYFMAVVMDWELIYRDMPHFQRLMDTTKAKDSYEIIHDTTETELYALATR